MEAGSKFVIIGAGPAGLAAADELARRGEHPLVVEMGSQVGGIARTVLVGGNRMDIGGHRFLSKSQKVTNWWLSILPLQGAPAPDDIALKRGLPLAVSPDAPDPALSDPVMLVRRRLSHIRYAGRLFDYPVTLTPSTLRRLGLTTTVRIAFSYLLARIRPIRPESSLEDFMVNRFGRTLYELFFKDYTNKVWGVPCSEIDAAWGYQRIQGISIGEVLRHAWRTLTSNSMDAVEKSLTGWFYYPKLGPGQLWEAVGARVEAAGGEVALASEVTRLTVSESRVLSVEITDRLTGTIRTVDRPDAVYSSMPLADLVGIVGGDRPSQEVIEVAKGLPFRDFITVGMLVDRIEIADPDGGPLLDTWLYVQEPEMRLGRIQIFNNWSPYLVSDPDRVWLGLEYFCAKGDDLWVLSDEEMASFAAGELERLGMIERANVRDTNVLRVEKAYPAYFDSHARIDVVREWADSVENLFVMGRNGMHRYNNMDDSVLSAWAAVAASFGEESREAIWSADASSSDAENPASTQRADSRAGYRAFIACAALLLAVCLAFQFRGVTARKFVSGHRTATVADAAQGYRLLQRSGVKGRTIVLFDTTSHIQTRFASEYVAQGGPAPTSDDLVNAVLMAGIARQIYVVVPQRGWDRVEHAMAQRGDTIVTSDTARSRIWGNPVTYVNASSLPSLPEKVIAYVQADVVGQYPPSLLARFKDPASCDLYLVQDAQ